MSDPHAAVRLPGTGPLRVHAWQVTGNEFFRTIVEEILDYVVREMTDPVSKHITGSVPEVLARSG